MRIAWFVLPLCAAVCSGCMTKTDRNQSAVRAGGFSVRVTLSRQARSAVERTHASVVVRAFFDGDPLHKGGAVNDEGLVDLGQSTTKLEASGVAQFTPLALTHSQIALLASLDYRVLVNVYSVRTGEPNLLDCPIVEDRISVLRGKLWTVRCGLIGEPGFPK